MKGRISRPMGLRIIAMALLVALFATGCALIPEEVTRSEPSAYLEYSPQIYGRFSGKALRDLTRDMDDQELGALFSKALPATAESQGSSQPQASAVKGKSSNSTTSTAFIREFLSKTNSFGMGIRDFNTQKLKAEAIFLGQFSPISLRLALTMEGNWERLQEGGYKSTQYPLYLRSPQAGWVHISTESAPGMKPEAKQAYPRPMESIASSDIFISINEPRILFAGALPLEASAIPLETVLLAGKLTEPNALAVQASAPASALQADSIFRNYLMDLYIVVKDEATARAYRPVVRFLWAAAASRLFPGRSDISSLALSLEGAVYVVRGITLSRSDIQRMILSSTTTP